MQNSRCIKSLLNSLMCLLLVFSLSTVAYAEGDIKVDGDQDNGVTTARGTRWFPEQCGFRTYIIDAEGNVVSKVIDTIATTQNLDINYMYINTRFDSGLRRLTNSYLNYGLATTASEIGQYCVGKSDFCWPCGRGSNGEMFSAQGDRFKAWFGVEDSNGRMRMQKFIAFNDSSGNYLFEKVNSKGEGIWKWAHGDKAESLSTHIAKYHWTVVFEPITWYNHISSSGTSAGKVIYGSLWNHLQYDESTDYNYAKSSTGTKNGGKLSVVYSTVFNGFYTTDSTYGEVKIKTPVVFPKSDTKSRYYLPDVYDRIVDKNQGYAIGFFVMYDNTKKPDPDPPDPIPDPETVTKPDPNEAEPDVEPSLSVVNTYNTATIKSDEITAAIKIAVNANSAAVATSLTNKNTKCTNSAKHPKVSDKDLIAQYPVTDWLDSQAHLTTAGTKAWNFLYSKTAMTDPFTIIGTDPSSKGYTNDKYRLRWLGDYSGLSSLMNIKDPYVSNAPNMLQYWKPANPNAEGAQITFPGTQVELVALVHRSGGSSDTKTPLLSSYMNNTSENRRFLNFAGQTGLPVNSGYSSDQITDSHYGYQTGSDAYRITFKVLGNQSVGYSTSNGLQVANAFKQFYGCYYWWKETITWTTTKTETTTVKDPVTGKNVTKTTTTIVHHSKEVEKTEDRSHTEIYNSHVDSSAITKVAKTINKRANVYEDITVKGTYVSSDLDSELNTVDTDALNTPNVFAISSETNFSFYPSYIMRATYNEGAYDGSGITEGYREPVWMLGANERHFGAENITTIVANQSSNTKVKSTWSTDNTDRNSGLVAKAGSAYKAETTGETVTVRSVVWMQDPGLADPSKRSAIISSNAKSLQQHSDAVAEVQSMCNNNRGSGNAFFAYSNIPGAYDVALVRDGFTELKNGWANRVIQSTGSKLKQTEYKHYNDATYEGDLGTTQLGIDSVSSSVGTTSVKAYYLNKNYSGDSSYTNTDYSSNRSVNINGQNVTLTPIDVSQTSSISGVTNSAEKAVIRNAIANYKSQLEKGSGSMSWYKEDYEGIICVVLSTTVKINSAKSEVSTLWRNLSDWTDTAPITLETAGPAQNMPAYTNDNDKYQPGVGFGIASSNFKAAGKSYGKVILYFAPNTFNIRGSVYDNVTK